jgi:hypothetical protein
MEDHSHSENEELESDHEEKDKQLKNPFYSGNEVDENQGDGTKEDVNNVSNDGLGYDNEEGEDGIYQSAN